MTVSEFTFRLILLFLPGIIAYLIAGYLTSHHKNSLGVASILSLVLGFLSYSTFFVVKKSFGCIGLIDESEFHLLKVLDGTSTAIQWREVVWVDLPPIFATQPELVFQAVG